jgi:hypothetical protein
LCKNLWIRKPLLYPRPWYLRSTNNKYASKLRVGSRGFELKTRLPLHTIGENVEANNIQHIEVCIIVVGEMGV